MENNNIAEIDEKTFKGGIRNAALNLQKSLNQNDKEIKVEYLENDMILRATKGDKVLYQFNIDYTEEVSIIKYVGSPYFVIISIEDSMYKVEYFNMGKKTEFLKVLDEKFIEDLINEMILK